MRIGFVLDYLNYYVNSGNRHSIHSPFVYQLADQVIYNDCHDAFTRKVESIRKSLKKDQRIIELTELGAGSTLSSYKKVSVASLVNSSAKSPRYARLLYRLVQHFKPATMLELGTSLGLSAMYQASGNPEGKLITIEGNPDIAEIAKSTIANSDLRNIEVVTGSFEEQLPMVLNRLPQLDYVFIDGNHRKTPTLNYFEQCLAKSHNNTIFVFDDINWSDEMKGAWQQIKLHKKTRVSIDLFMLGIVFLNPELSKQDFTIRF
jgi:predicted O-methyltransferase YrrM